MLYSKASQNAIMCYSIYLNHKAMPTLSRQRADMSKKGCRKDGRRAPVKNDDIYDGPCSNRRASI